MAAHQTCLKLLAARNKDNQVLADCSVMMDMNLKVQTPPLLWSCRVSISELRVTSRLVWLIIWPTTIGTKSRIKFRVLAGMEAKMFMEVTS